MTSGAQLADRRRGRGAIAAIAFGRAVFARIF